jgi:hypothetical protein
VKYYNYYYQPQVYKVGDLVLLLTKNLKLKRLSKKLTVHFIKYFNIAELVRK